MKPMNPSSRRHFLRSIGGLGLAAGMPPWLDLGAASEGGTGRKVLPKRASSVELIGEFRAKDFLWPEAVLWPGYFWLWNAPLDPERVSAQLADMAAHDARSVCVLPMPHGFRPDSTNNDLNPDYLTPAYFQRVGAAVDQAAGLGMAWWLYDEGGWPSGQALGKVVEGHPELTRRTLTRKQIPAAQPYRVPAEVLALVVEGADPKVVLPGNLWEPSTPSEVAHAYQVGVGGGVDLLNPAATERFIGLTHERYAEVLGRHLGTTVKFTFTDEPSAGMPQPPRHVPWFPGLAQAYESLTGRSFLADLPRLFVEPNERIPLTTAQARVALYDLLTERFASAYFEPLRDWARRNRLASGGHLGGEDETLGAIKYGFGHLLRQLRPMDVPGVDLIWRQLFPGREGQSNFPLAAATIAHQNGTRFAFSESFCVYGNGLTPGQMKWLTDYQYLRGVNLLVIGCYPLSTRDHHMTGERPHFGPMNPLWDHLPGYHGYVARLGYAASVGSPVITTALYYPARDMWAWGGSAREAVDSFEALGGELMARQCPYDLVDDDAFEMATVKGRDLVVGAMRYRTIVCGRVQWMAPLARQRLEAFAAAGGDVRCVDHVPDCVGGPGMVAGRGFKVAPLPRAVEGVVPLITLAPADRSIRAIARQCEGQRVVVVFNEGTAEYRGDLEAPLRCATELDLMTGAMVRRAVVDRHVEVNLLPGETRAFVFSKRPMQAAEKALEPCESLTIDPATIHAVSGREFRVGEHDFETRPRTFDRVPLTQSGVWKDWLGEDYSGEVDYWFKLEVPGGWRGSCLQVETGPVDYSATVFLDGRKAGHVLWAPWRVLLPECQPGTHVITIKVANTLANELTSERVSQAWSQKKGPGWPSPYHERALKFERESRGGGLAGPVRIIRLL